MVSAQLLFAAGAATSAAAQATNCIDPHAGPVLGGIDMVAFGALDDTKTEDVPAFGTNSSTSLLNGYSE